MTEKRHTTDHYFVPRPRSQPKFGLIRTALRGRYFEFLTSSGIFSKKQIDLGTRLLIETMALPESGCALDIGCGYGAVGVVAASFNPGLRVVMTDVNVRAANLARQNAEKNKLRNIEVRCGYLYEPVRDLTFDCVLSNPPVSAGTKVIKAIIAQAPQVMADKATFQMVIRSKIGAKTLPMFFNEIFNNCQVLARRSGYRVLLAENHKSA
jgi:16S rRNA (guanine1207-N2)-methyltransferase